MLPTPKNHAIYPSVVISDQPCEMTIVPNERAFLFFEDEEYTLTVNPTHADANYYAPSSVSLNAVAKDGVLRFSYSFAGEGEHLFRLFRGEALLSELWVYSLHEDLYALTPLKGDFHAHSFRSDGKRDPAALAGHYREQGYDFFSLTDHNRFYPGNEVDEVYANVKTDFLRIRGEEVHTPGSPVHIVHVGGTESVADQYVRDPEQYQAELEEYLTRVPCEVPEAFRSRYAAAMWATERIHRAGGIAIFPHPYWRPGTARAFNVCDELAERLLLSGMFDAYELLGAMKQDGINRSVTLWSELRATKGLQIPIVGSSDVHGIEKSHSFPNLFTICFAIEKEHDAILEAVKSYNTVAVEATGAEYKREYRLHGSLRLVSYARFLMNVYFPEYQRVAQGGGVAMRAYAMEDAPKELVELNATLAKNFRLRFFGRIPPALPSPEMLAFESRHRERHLQGPKTKGSALSSTKITMQI